MPLARPARFRSTGATARRRLLSLTAVSAVALAGLAATSSTATADPPSRDDLNGGPADIDGGVGGGKDAAGQRLSERSGKQAFLVTLDVRSTMQAQRAEGARSQAGRAAGRRQLSDVQAAQRRVIANLPADTPVLYRTHAVLSAVAVRTDAGKVPQIEKITGVKRVYPIAPKSLSNSYAVPLMGAPTAWQDAGATGDGVSVAVIDSGIDYTHANFGGPGTVGAFNTADDSDTEPVAAGSYDPAKLDVAASYDLVGDDYDAAADSGSALIPVPDPNPLDCGGHGSHVAGSAVGYGEDADGATYAGAYDEDTPFDTMQIGPGMAPEATLIGLRVFGCDGSTDVVTEAIDRAMDPNQDGSTDDRADVINMSLGGDYGGSEDGDSVASDAASDAGVTVVVAAGNGGDYTDVAGSPGNAQSAISVANSQDASNVNDGLNVTIGSDTSQYAVTKSIAYDYATKPDIAGDVVYTTDDNLTGCDAYPAGTDFGGDVVMVEWDAAAVDVGTECGSVARGANISAAGGGGFIFAGTSPTFDAGITGDADIPGVLIALAGGDAIRSALEAGTAVSVDGTEANAVTQEFPEDNDKIAGSSSRGIHEEGNLKPDVAAVGTSVLSTNVGTGNVGVGESGTSMASPMVAGLAALVRQAHPAWTPEQVKAGIMNTAGQDVFTGDDHSGDVLAPVRVGAGRVEARDAVSNDVLAYVADDKGAVSVSFGPVEVSEATTLTKTVTVENTGGASATYDVGYDAVTEVPGVDFTVSPSSVTVAAGQSTQVTVTMSAPDPKALTKTVDPTIGRTALGAPYPRETLAEASGRVLLTPADGLELRVPVYAAPRPASTMSQPDSLALAADATEGTLTLSGKDVGISRGENGTGDGDADNDVFSIAAGFELAANDPAQPRCGDGATTECINTDKERAADIRHVGVTSDAPYAPSGDAMAYFAIAAEGPFNVPASWMDYEVYLDVDDDLAPDLVAYSTRLGTDDVYVTYLVDLATGATVDVELDNGRFGDVDTALYDSDVLMMPVLLDALSDYGVDADNPRVNYGVLSFASSMSGPVDTVGLDPETGDLTLSADLFEPAISVTDEDGSGPLVLDADGADLTVARNAEAYQADGGLGILMVHFHNAVGDKAQVVDVGAQTSTTLAAAPTRVVRGATSRLTVTVAESGGATPTGKVSVVDTATRRVIGTATLAGGVARLSYRPVRPQTAQLQASYLGDGAFASSTSAPIKVVATKAKATVRIKAPSTVRRGRSAKVIVKVPTVNKIAATGGVVLKVGSRKFFGNLRKGRVAIPIAGFRVGRQKVVAIYRGDATYTGDRATKVIRVRR